MICLLLLLTAACNDWLRLLHRIASASYTLEVFGMGNPKGTLPLRLMVERVKAFRVEISAQLAITLETKLFLYSHSRTTLLPVIPTLLALGSAVNS